MQDPAFKKRFFKNESGPVPYNETFPEFVVQVSWSRFPKMWDPAVFYRCPYGTSEILRGCFVGAPELNVHCKCVKLTKIHFRT